MFRSIQRVIRSSRNTVASNSQVCFSRTSVPRVVRAFASSPPGSNDSKNVAPPLSTQLFNIPPAKQSKVSDWKNVRGMVIDTVMDDDPVAKVAAADTCAIQPQKKIIYKETDLTRQSSRIITTSEQFQYDLQAGLTPSASPALIVRQPNLKPVLDPDWVSEWKDKKVDWGFNGFGACVFYRTYSRTLENGASEQWYQTVQRVVNGSFNMQRRWVLSNGTTWSNIKGEKDAQMMYERIFKMKFLPPGRGLWAMGSPITEERGLFAALNNCAFVSTGDMDKDAAKPFTFLMDVSMLGVGCGFDTLGAGKIVVKGPNRRLPTETYVVPDSREGWVEAVKLKLESHFYGTAHIEYDFSKVRPYGVAIKGFGGQASGPGPLDELLKSIDKSLSHKDQVGKGISITTIVDIQNMIGKCVVAGNVRRTAEIAFGPADSDEYLDLKNYKKNPQRAAHGWASNNSVFATVGQDYSKICDRVRVNGEPGFAWLANMRKYGRMNSHPVDLEKSKKYKDNKGVEHDGIDWRVAGGNPCLEQSLESYEMCNLVELFPHKHESLEDFLITAKIAYRYGKSVTLGRTHIPETNECMGRNRRIGLSMSGLAQFITHRGLSTLQNWCDTTYLKVQEYDKIYSEWFQTPRSIKTTSVKPSGTISLLAGSTPGIHFPLNKWYVRRMRLAKNSHLIVPLKKAGIPMEPAADAPNDTIVIEWPICVDEKIRTEKEVPLLEQMAIAAVMQRHWADNQISSTFVFGPHEAHQLEAALDVYQTQLKGGSFLPRLEKGTTYAQMPYEAITKEEYERRLAMLKPVDFSTQEKVTEAAVPERYCNNDTCEVPVK